MYGKMQDFTAPVYVLLLSFPQVFVPYEAKESGSGKVDALTLNMTFSILIKRCFPVAHDEKSSYKKV